MKCISNISLYIIIILYIYFIYYFIYFSFFRNTLCIYIFLLNTFWLKKNSGKYSFKNNVLIIILLAVVLSLLH